jgi:hypothetical protein
LEIEQKTLHCIELNTTDNEWKPLSAALQRQKVKLLHEPKIENQKRVFITMSEMNEKKRSKIFLPLTFPHTPAFQTSSRTLGLFIGQKHRIEISTVGI